jgi:hypothetical protein
VTAGYNESSRSDGERAARRLLRQRVGEMASGKFVGPAEERVTFEELMRTVLDDFLLNRVKTRVDMATDIGLGHGSSAESDPGGVS